MRPITDDILAVMPKLVATTLIDSVCLHHCDFIVHPLRESKHVIMMAKAVPKGPLFETINELNG